MKRQWQVRRTTVAMPDAQERWERAYQLLLQCASTGPPGMVVSPTPTVDVFPEVSHAGSGVCPCFDQPSGAAADD